MADPYPPPVRFAFYLFVPVAFILLLPLLLLFAVGFYLLAFLQGLRAMLAMVWGKQDSADSTWQKPHFLEKPVAFKFRSEDESNQAT